jgi:NADH-ubiquinone oxidoreductase chain 6
MYLLNDYTTNGFNIDIINILSVLAIISGILVITTKNPIVSVLFLITLFFNVACFLIIIGITFIGLTYLLVYVGAISILFLFILMLINIRISELLNKTSNSLPLILIVFVLISFVMINLLPTNYNNIVQSYNPNYNFIYLYDNPLDTIYTKLFIGDINYTSSFTWDGNIIEFNALNSMGNIMYTSYPMWLIITSLILLLAMVGVIVITTNSNENK